MLELQVRGGRVEQVTVDMGIPALSPAVSVEAEGETYTVWPVDVGNPHGVVFCPAPEAVPLERVGPILEGSGAFPQRINVEFAAARTRERLEARVWERGSGITLACGTGACAVLAAAVRTGRCGRRAAVRLPGGVLELDWDRDSGHIWMTGPAVTVFEGEVD